MNLEEQIYESISTKKWLMKSGTLQLLAVYSTLKEILPTTAHNKNGEFIAETRVLCIFRD